MNEDKLIALRQQDQNLRDAIRQDVKEKFDIDIHPEVNIV